MSNPFLNKISIMGVVNVTPDSFSDGGRYFNADKAIEHGLRLIEEGADMLDIGGESTRPGADEVSEEEELKRVLPVIEALAEKVEWLSIDTRRARVMEEAIQKGANFINDISALSDDQESLIVASELNVPICLMHKAGSPKTMQKNTDYDDVVADVFAYLAERIRICEKYNIHKERLVVDPGIGFGKTLEQNMALFNKLDMFHDLDCPVMLGASRKRFIEASWGDELAPDDRLPGSLAAALYGLNKGVQIFRVHDVKETRQAFQIYKGF